LKTICLISCVSQKLAVRAPAKYLYVSPLFKGAFDFARAFRPDAIYILSAKYGLIEENDEIDPYNLTLNGLSTAQVKRWAQATLAQLKDVADVDADKFIILAGDRYRKYLVPHLAHYEVPLEGMSIGRQLQFLKRHRE
jgi:cytoplasmic iron level regulating protein YaaA (DUF328/UPF0246 family)